MRALELAVLAALVAAPVPAFAGEGNVVRTLRPQLATFDDKGQPLGRIPATALKLPAPIVGHGVGNSIGVRHGGKVVYLRGLDVQTDAVRTTCAPSSTAARQAKSSYAATNMGLGGACQ